MIINTEDIERLLRMPIPDLTLEREAGVTRQTIFNARKGNSNLDKMWMGTAKKLQKWIDENMQFTYVCSEVLDDAKGDREENGNVNVLAMLKSIEGHEVIYDYLQADAFRQFGPTDLEVGDKMEFMTIDQLIDKLEEQNG